MQTVAQGYLAYQLTHSAFLVGVVTALNALPSTFFSLIGGTYVDRFRRKTLLQTTQLLLFAVATALGILVLTNQINFINLCVLVFLMGIVNSVDQPARMSNVAFMVEREHIHSAQAMNMATFNSARVIGPAIAGLLIYKAGIGWAFVLNGISFLAPFVAYRFIDFGAHIPQVHKGTFHAIKEGLKYTFTHKLVKNLIIYMALISIFGFSYTTVLPVISSVIFNKDAQGLGWLYSTAGIGSVLGALLASVHSEKFKPALMILVGGLFYSISLFLFSLTKNFNLALLTLFFGGFGIIIQNATIQSSIQKNIEDHFRGRVASIQALAFMGTVPIGAFQVGLISEYLGPQLAIRLGTIIIFASGLFLFFKLKDRY